MLSFFATPPLEKGDSNERLRLSLYSFGDSHRFSWRLLGGLFDCRQAVIPGFKC